MILLLKSQLRFAARHPVGPAASFAGVVLAVLAIVAVHLVSQSIRANLDDPSIGGYTHIATREALVETDYFELRRRWRTAASDEGQAGNDGGWARSVRAMFPVIEGHVEIDGQPRRIIGFDPVAAGGLVPASTPLGAELEPNNPSTVQRLARFLTDDAVMVSPDTARAIALGGGVIGDVPVVVLEAATQVVLADLPTAQRLLGRDSQIDGVWLVVENPRTRLLAWLDQLLPGIAASLPRYTDPRIEGYHVTAASRWNPSRRFADAILFNLGMLSVLCLFMATFIAFQASASNAARRRTEQARLLAIGAPGAALRAMACTEGFVIGVAGAIVGIGLGAYVADALLQAAMPETTDTTPAAGEDPGRPTLTGWVIGKAFACAVLASTLGPLAEGRFKASVSLRTVVGLLALALAVVGLANGTLGWVFLALAAVCAVQVVVAVPLAGTAAAPLASLGRSLSTRANLRAAAAKSGEIRLALGALSVAAAVAIGMGLMVESLRRDFTEMLDVRLAPGIYIETEADVAASELDAIRDLAGVRDARRYGIASARVAQGPVDVRLAELDATETARYGFQGALEGRAMLNEVGARLYGIRAGDTITMIGAGGSFPVEVAHVFRDFGAFASRVILPTTFLADLDASGVHWRRLAVKTEPLATRTLAAKLGERYGASRVLNHDEIRSLAMAVFDRSFVVSRSLAVLALVVAAIGLYAALTALQAGRRREFRLLSAIGHSHAQLWRLAMAQTAALGAMALFASLPLGLALAWLLCDFVNPAAFGWSISLHVDFASIAGPLMLGALAVAAAGAVPAFRMAYRGTP
ncbi:MAG: FtsX-like permease family protein [Gammaproteobacteria bacterium]|nr:FtsX-like permease family protein [Gammaproteobacteria bacterium]